MIQAFEHFRLVESFPAVDTMSGILDLIENAAADFGATHFLATGLPMPGRPLENLIIRKTWASANSSSPVYLFSSGDMVLRECLTARRPLVWEAEFGGEEETGSSILASVGEQGRVTLVAVPINERHPYQGCVIFAGPHLSISDRDLLGYDLLCQCAFAKLERLGIIKADRPGDLSKRERVVIEMTAKGRTALEIARRLDISQRTVHAHLQNSSDKLKASNKTHTVVEAIRYGQMSV